MSWCGMFFSKLFLGKFLKIFQIQKVYKKTNLFFRWLFPIIKLINYFQIFKYLIFKNN